MELGNRMKRYEISSRHYLVPKGYVLIRVDGKAFHTLTRGMDRPFDRKLIDAMVYAAEKTSKDMMGFKLAFTQSNECTFCITDTQKLDSQLWFDGEVEKICSVTASLYTYHFNRALDTEKVAAFDARCFNIANCDVANNFVWRQRDWERNSLQMFGRSFFSHKEMQNKDGMTIHEMLFKKGQNWANLEDVYKNGTFITPTKERICKRLSYAEINKLIGIEE
jgi:tRNA(His) 5'-end guanylyltransferase